MPRLGAHLSIAGGLPRAVDRAEASGCQALQIFTKSAGQWRARDLPPEARVQPAEISSRGLTFETLSEFKEFAEREFLVTKLRENGWNISRTAEVIQTPRSNLYKKIEHHKINRESDA